MEQKLTYRQQIVQLTKETSTNKNTEDIQTYIAANDQTPLDIAKELDVDVKLIVAWNKDEYKGLKAKSR